MTGNKLKLKLRNLGVELTDLASQIGISKQALNSKLKAKDIGVGFLTEVSKAVNKNIYYFIDGKYPVANEREPEYERESKPDLLTNSLLEQIEVLKEMVNDKKEIINLLKKEEVRRKEKV